MVVNTSADIRKFCIDNLSYVLDGIDRDSDILYYPYVNVLIVHLGYDYSSMPLWSDVSYDVLTFCELYFLKYGPLSLIYYTRFYDTIGTMFNIDTLSDIDYITIQDNCKLASIHLPLKNN